MWDRGTEAARSRVHVVVSCRSEADNAQHRLTTRSIDATVASRLRLGYETRSNSSKDAEVREMMLVRHPRLAPTEAASALFLELQRWHTKDLLSVQHLDQEF